MFSKLKLLPSSIIFTAFFCVSQTTPIPDINFEQALIDVGIDDVIDGSVLTSTIAAVQRLEIDGHQISDLTGIEDFTGLTILDCSNNLLSNLNLSNNPLLEELYCHANRLTGINTSQNTNLKILWCYNNRLSTINIANNPNLISFICSNNLLTAANVSSNANLVIFICDFNQITSLDVSQNLQLDFLTCSNNLLSNLDLSNNINLQQLRCNFNTLGTLNLFNNVELFRLHCHSNLLTNLNIASNSKLSDLICNNNQLTDLNVSNNYSLRELTCFNNNLETLDVSKNEQLVYLDCHSNNLCTLDLRNNRNNNLAFLDATSNPSLACIFVDNVSYSDSYWAGFVDGISNFVSSEEACSAVNPLTPPVDSLENFNGTSYTLPALLNGLYFTEPNGNGMQLSAGDIISSSQTIYIYNENGCFTNQSSFTVFITNSSLFIPRFFTPNADGNNDEWRVIDLENTINTISIYNRYGKLLKFLTDNTQSWDGTFNSMPLPNDSYWYTIVFNDAQVLTGYFALKR